MRDYLKKKYLYGMHKVLINLLKLYGIKIGEKTWILVNLLRQAGLNPEKLKIGRRCVICSNTVFLCGDAYGLLLKRRSSPGNEDGPSTQHDGIIIKDNCFIGIGAIIMNGVSIGPNAIVGAGTVVFNDVKPNTCVAGNPGRFVCSLDTYSKVSELMEISSYNQLSPNGISKKDFLTDYFWKQQ